MFVESPNKETIKTQKNIEHIKYSQKLIFWFCCCQFLIAALNLKYCEKIVKNFNMNRER